jgi:hypothetical protein
MVIKWSGRRVRNGKKVVVDFPPRTHPLIRVLKC